MNVTALSPVDVDALVRRSAPTERAPKPDAAELSTLAQCVGLIAAREAFRIAGDPMQRTLSEEYLARICAGAAQTVVAYMELNRRSHAS